MLETLILIYIILWIIPCMIIAHTKNKDLGTAFLASLLFGLFALIYYIFVQSELPKEKEMQNNNKCDTEIQSINCNKKFTFEKSYKEHPSQYSIKKDSEKKSNIYSVNDDTDFLFWISLLLLIGIFVKLCVVFSDKGMVSIFNWFIPISIIIIVGYVLYFKFYLREIMTKWLVRFY
ncbi:hypothetical protein [Methanoculleus sp.]|uniref:hypothetical protein n=1 Tax=Methanoculleus sp. TaxID=90427 RepID=UPI0025FC17B5|nr:hypothetical protein [Methanoculleus sp.]MCK9319904.1 hypothetical protein [Methanoculleus sp.]